MQIFGDEKRTRFNHHIAANDFEATLLATVETIEVVMQQNATFTFKLRGRELNPGLPRDRQKY